MEGGEIYDWVVEIGEVPEEKAKRVLIQVLSALEYFHTQGIKYKFLMVCDTNFPTKFSQLEKVYCVSKSQPWKNIKLATWDFFPQSRKELRNRWAYNMCYVCMCRWNFTDFSAPEELLEKSTSGQMDMWSLGAITFVMYAIQIGA